MATKARATKTGKATKKKAAAKKAPAKKATARKVAVKATRTPKRGKKAIKTGLVRVLCVNGTINHAILGYGADCANAYRDAENKARAFCYKHGGTQKITRVSCT